MTDGSQHRGRSFLQADDFGLSATINHGILQSFRHGLLTGASLLANAPAAEEAAAAWHLLERERREELPSRGVRQRLDDPNRPFDLGVHLNLTQGRPLTDDYPAALRRRDGTFAGVWQLFATLSRRRQQFLPAIEREFDAQLARLSAWDLSPTHLDGHQYAELMPGVGSIVAAIAARRGIHAVRVARERGLGRTTLPQGRLPAFCLSLVKRRYAARFADEMRRLGMNGSDLFFGTAHAGRVTIDVWRRFLDVAGSQENVEVGLHPGGVPSSSPVAGEWIDPLELLRPIEAKTLQSAELVELLVSRGVRLGRIFDLTGRSTAEEVAACGSARGPA